MSDKKIIDRERDVHRHTSVPERRRKEEIRKNFAIGIGRFLPLHETAGEEQAKKRAKN